MLDNNRLRQIIDGFARAKILVVGDLILDQFIWGDVSRISPEAPVPVVVAQRESFMPGGAANAAANVRSLGAQASVAGVVGYDSFSEKIRKELYKQGVNVHGVMTDAARQTTLKIRIVARHQQVVRLDKEVIMEVGGRILRRITDYIEKKAGSHQAVIIEDYGKGMITPALLKAVTAAAKRKKLMVIVDPKEEHFSYYRGVTCITPNQQEAGIAAGLRIVDEKSLLAAGKKLLRKLELAAVLITRGEHGMCLFERRGGAVTHIPTVAREVFDVSGAGDTVISAFALSLAAGASFKEAAYISNYAAGVVVGKLGVATCSVKELIDCVDRVQKENNGGK